MNCATVVAELRYASHRGLWTRPSVLTWRAPRRPRHDGQSVVSHLVEDDVSRLAETRVARLQALRIHELKRDVQGHRDLAIASESGGSIVWVPINWFAPSD
jgi:hypothetical protein